MFFYSSQLFFYSIEVCVGEVIFLYNMFGIDDNIFI